MLNVHRTAVAFKSASNKRVQHLQGVPRGDQIGERMQVPANARQYQELRLSCTLSLSLSLSLSPSLSLSLSVPATGYFLKTQVAPPMLFIVRVELLNDPILAASWFHLTSLR